MSPARRGRVPRYGVTPTMLPSTRSSAPGGVEATSIEIVVGTAATGAVATGAVATGAVATGAVATGAVATGAAARTAGAGSDPAISAAAVPPATSTAPSAAA